MQEAGGPERPSGVYGQGGEQDQPVREYIASLVRELAQMARRDGDEPLGAVLDAAAMFARRSA